MKTKKKMQNNESKDANYHQSTSISRLQACTVHIICGIGLGFAFWVAHNLYSINLVSHPSPTLRLICIVEIPIVILLFSQFRLNPNQCSYFRAVGRSLLALPLGALANAFGAIALGAPIGIMHLKKTFFWSLLMSSLTFVPVASVFGSSWTHWQRIFAQTKPNEPVEYMICIPAHGAIIGAWFGAWPMPLDWESPWQEWPISVTYGAIIGYLVAMVASSIVVLTRQGQHHVKRH